MTLVVPGINATHGRRISKTVGLALQFFFFFLISSVRSERDHIPRANLGI